MRRALNPFHVLADIASGWRRYTIRAWLIATLPPLGFFLLRVALGTATYPAAAEAPASQVVLYSLVAAPIVETTLMLAFARLLATALPGRERYCIAALALICALAHWPGGGAGQAILALWPFLVYSAALFAWRHRSWRAAFFVTAAVHALYNATILAVGFGASLAGAASSAT